MHTLFQSTTLCEQWILQVVLLEHERILQLGYQLPLNPTDHAQLWAHYFDEAQNRFHSESFDFADFRRSEKFFFVQLGKSWLRQQAALGELRPSKAHWFWDIELEEADHMPDYPPLFRLLPPTERKKLVLCADRVNLRASGVLRLPETLQFENEPACLIRQGIQASQWQGFWGHCNSFLEDDDAVLEIYCTKYKWNKYKLRVFLQAQGNNYWFSGIMPRFSLKNENQIRLQDNSNQLEFKLWPLSESLNAYAAGIRSGLSSIELQITTAERQFKLSAGDSLTLFMGRPS